MNKPLAILAAVTFLLVSTVALLGIQTWRLSHSAATQDAALAAMETRTRTLTSRLDTLETQWTKELDTLTLELQQADQDQDAFEASLDQGMARIQDMYFDLLKENDGLDTIWNSRPSGKVAYLTFDDGPSANTRPVLDILKREKIKATFFVNGRPAWQDSLRLIQDQGHTIGNHGYTHDYDQIYQSVDAFVADMDRLDAWLGELRLTFQPLYRFPGGAKNTWALRLGGPDLTARISAAMAERGYHFYEWNVSGEDSESRPDGTTATAADITATILRQARYKRIAVVLLHDGPGHAEVVKALPGIIAGLRTLGFTFKQLP